MPSVFSGSGAVTPPAEKLRYAELSEIFDDSQQVESDWYVAAVRPLKNESFLMFLGCNVTRV